MGTTQVFYFEELWPKKARWRRLCLVNAAVCLYWFSSVRSALKNDGNSSVT